MSYYDLTIKDIVTKISNNEVYLPALQRKFVWGHEQIEKLFDSIMLDYPIGTFLFWNVDKDKIQDYVFYKFIQEYHERDNYLNELAPWPHMRDTILGVLDGQQRLSSLYLALQGSYSYKKPKARRNSPDAYPKRELYFNLLRDKPQNVDDDVTYEFKFLTEEEATFADENCFWIPVKEALNWKRANDFMRYAQEKGYAMNTTFTDNLTLLWQRISNDKIINYFEVKADDLDNILDIFVRVNSGGTQLSKSDLLFSTIVANWEEAREEIEELLKCLNTKGETFNFDNDFIMRSCLVLTDCPVLFQVKNFKKENIIVIKQNWNLIKEAIKKTVDLLVEFGFNQDNLTSKNAIIPIAYYIFKGGKLGDSDKNNIRLYLISSLLKLIYGGKSDQVLEAIRNSMREKEKNTLKTLNFPYDVLVNIKLPADKSLSFTDEDIEELFDSKKSPYTFMVLSLLYPQLKLNQVKFHQDHIHPSSMFGNTSLKNIQIPKDKMKLWQDMKDKLPNLQLMEGIENETKNKTPLKIWVENNVQDKTAYKISNYIPNVDLSLSNFENFFEERKKLMVNRFKQIMNFSN